MIKTNFNINTSNVDAADHLREQPTTKVADQSVTNNSITTSSSPAKLPAFGTAIPSRMGENRAASNLLKSNLLNATAPRDNFFSLKNGDITTQQPANGNNNASHTIYINGIEEWPGLATSQGQALADAAGVPVDTIYQQSTIGNVAIKELATIIGRVIAKGPFFGTAETIKNIRADLVDKLQNPVAANKAADQIMAQLGGPDSKAEVRLIGYSQGAAISAQALKLVSQRLTSQYGSEKASEMLGRIHMLSIGGAARRSEFPPQVELTQLSHRHDVVTQVFGDNKTSIFGDVLYGGGLLPHLSYMTSDKKALDVVTKWEQGLIKNQDIVLKDVLSPL